MLVYSYFSRSLKQNTMCALIKLSAIGITTISGKTDGQVFANSGRGRYVKNFTMPTNPMTVAQQAVRAAFAIISQAWRQLTQPQQEAWNTAAPGFPILNRLGDVIILSGQMLFQQLNLNLTIIGEANLTAPPAQEGTQDITLTTLDADTSGGTLTLSTVAPIAVTDKATIRATPPVSAGVSNVNSLYKQIAIADDTTFVGPMFDQDFANAYEAVFGVLPAVGSKVFLSVTPFNKTTGERGTPQSLSAIAE